MTTCAHRDLRLEKGTRYRCAGCGEAFVLVRHGEPAATQPVQDPPPELEDVDVSGQISRYVNRDRRLPSNARR